ncbi:SPOR domain-containing protein [Morganella morganii]|uniref:SPOR domain-containing protein n=1 Tax=Morganella morganii TaxID=582 RepID=UPI0021D10E7B|nr:SPOR domain-containing protein [Morganella morganii]
MTHKKSTVLVCLLAGVLISPAAVNGSPVLPPVSERDSAAALYQVGVMWMNGEGVEQDIAQGRYWIHLAARHGYPLAQYNLGVMYFDGIGGTYSRQCAQWWLNRAAAQEDPEVRQMAGQALQSIVPEMAQLPKVYRPVTARECDRLPEWRRHGHPSAISELPDGDIDTEKMVPAEASPVTAPEQEEQAAVSPVPEAAAAKTETETAKDAVKETAEPLHTSSEKEAAALPVSGGGVSETEGGVVNDGVTEPVAAAGASDTEITATGAAEQQAPAENTVETVIRTDTRARTDTTSEGEVTEPENGKTDAETPESAVTGDNEQGEETGITEKMPNVQASADDGGDHTGITSADARIIPAPDAESFRTTGKESTGNQEAGAEDELSGATGKNTEMPADALPEKPGTLKPREIRPASVLNLGGSPATAPGRHYTLQLSGGTTPDELYRTARKHKLTNYLVYETERNGQRWFVLVAGEYATLTTANQALKALPAELRRKGPWVRALRQVQKELKL